MESDKPPPCVTALAFLIPSRDLPTRARYAFAVAVTAIASLIPLFVHPDLDDVRLPLIALIPAVILSTWIGGPGPGLVSTALAVIVAGCVWSLPGLTLRHLSPHDWLALGLLASVGLLVSILDTLVHRAVGEARQSAVRAEREAGERAEAEHALHARVRQQAAVAELGQHALAGADVHNLMDEAVALLCGTLGVDCSKVLELMPGGRELLLRSGVGWKPGCVGTAKVGAGLESQAGYTLLLGSDEPLIVDDLRTETRFNGPQLLRDHGVISGMSVVIPGRGGPFGVLGVHCASPRSFTKEDANFLRAVANIIASAIAREQIERERDGSLAEAQQANRLKDEFLATLSHEMRTPLNAILGWASLLRSGKLAGERQAQALDAILRNAHAQAELVSDVLDVSRIITGKLRLDLEALEIGSVVDGVVESLQPAAHAKDIALGQSCDRPAATLIADRVRLQQIVWNLVSNAIKFTPGGGRVTIDIRVVGSTLDLVVQDSGVGIHPDFLPHVFDRFRQADSSTTRQHGGLGLGLAIVRHLVELHGGTVSADSAGEGRGATFTVRLPLGRDAQLHDIASKGDTPSGEEAVQPATDGRMLSGLGVLVVDDDTDARDLLKTTLEQAGANVRVAASAPEALDLFTQRIPDLLVSDVGMPIIDGCALMRDIRCLPEREGGKVTAVAVTAYARATDRERALAAGFDMFFAKPFLVSEFLGALAALVGRAQTP